MKTDISTLLALCSEVRSDQRDKEKAWDVEASDEAVNLAQQHADSSFGAQAAAAFGEWHPLEVMAADCLQAAVQLTPYAVLRFTSHMEDGRSFELFGHCPTCMHDKTATVTNLISLAAALADVGVR